MPSLKAVNTTIVLALPLLALAELWTTWGLGYRTGFLLFIKERLTANPQLLPSVEVPVKINYTWIPPVDALIRRLNVFLWPAIDGTWPGLSLVAWEFSGQFSATWMIAGLEGLRQGNKGKLLTLSVTPPSYWSPSHETIELLTGLMRSTTIVGLLSQTITYGSILPLFLCLHLLTSPTGLGPSTSVHQSDGAVAALLVDPIEATAWPIAFTISYLLPTLLVSFQSPQYLSFNSRQIVMAFWELYPVPFKILQIVLTRWLTTYLTASTKQSEATQRSKTQSSLRSLRNLYAFAALVGFTTHLISLTLSFSTMFFPSLFQPSICKHFHPRTILLPTRSPLSTTTIEDAGEGLLHFLQYNMAISNIAPVLWALIQYRNAIALKAEKEWGLWDWAQCGFKAASLYILAGSGATVGWFMWQRDEMVIGDASTAPEKEKERGQGKKKA